MATFKLKNNRTESGTVPGVGNFVNGVLNNAPDNFENPNFEKVLTSAPSEANSTTPQQSTPASGLPSTPPVAPQSAPAPAAPIAPVAPVASPATPITPTQEGAK